MGQTPEEEKRLFFSLFFNTADHLFTSVCSFVELVWGDLIRVNAFLVLVKLDSVLMTDCSRDGSVG